MPTVGERKGGGGGGGGERLEKQSAEHFWVTDVSFNLQRVLWIYIKISNLKWKRNGFIVPQQCRL